jgi:hypothetical protein
MLKRVVLSAGVVAFTLWIVVMVASAGQKSMLRGCDYGGSAGPQVNTRATPPIPGYLPFCDDQGNLVEWRSPAP